MNATIPTPSSTGNGPATKAKVQAKLITIHRAEGPSDLCRATTHATWREAEDRIRAINYSAPKTGGYDKCDFKVEFADGEVYEGRYDAAHPESRAYEGGGIGHHIREHLTFIAGLRCPPHMKDEDYAKTLATLESRNPGCKDEAMKFLTKYALEDTMPTASTARVTPQVEALPGMTPLGLPLAKTFPDQAQALYNLGKVLAQPTKNEPTMAKNEPTMAERIAAAQAASEKARAEAASKVVAPVVAPKATRPSNPEDICDRCNQEVGNAMLWHHEDTGMALCAQCHLAMEAELAKEAAAKAQTVQAQPAPVVAKAIPSPVAAKSKPKASRAAKPDQVAKASPAEALAKRLVALINGMQFIVSDMRKSAEAGTIDQSTTALMEQALRLAQQAHERT